MYHKLLIVVVVYETELKKSQTLLSLAHIKAKGENLAEVLVFDNSRVSRQNNTFANIVTYYVHNSNNIGVAGAYNYAMDFGESLKKEFLVLFDQDTEVHPAFFSALSQAISNHPSMSLFCPTILSGTKIISPTYYYFHKPFFYKTSKIGPIKNRFYTALNSGLVVKVSALKELGGYDMELPLDYSDHYFIARFKKHYSYFVVFNCSNQHYLSGIFDEDFETVYSRFKKFYFSTSIYAKKVRSFFPLLWLTVRALKLTIKYKKLDFLRFILFKR